MKSTEFVEPPLAQKSRPGDAMSHRADEEGNGHIHAQDGTGQPPAEHDAVDLNVPKPPAGWIVAVGVTTVLAMIVLLVVGILPRLHTNKELAADAEAASTAPVPVNIVVAKRAPAIVAVRIPGTLRPWQEASLYARTTGYLRKFTVDISEQVKAGQVMAIIESPEVDQQLTGARATLQLQEAAAAKARTDMDFAAKTNVRYQSLRATSGVTQQELDQFQSQFVAAQHTLASAEANIAVAQADVQRLTEMQSFEQLKAPFSGVVTGRAYDVGSLILANPTPTDTQPMFKIAENDVLRAFVNVPQNYSLTIKKGMKVEITARELPGRKFIGTVLGTTNYLDPAARSLLTEIRIENPDFALLPGMFVDANFQMTRDTPPFIIPAPALVINADGNHVGVVRDGKVHFQKVDLGIDYGNDIEIVAGLDGSEKIIGNPGEKTIENADVTIVGEDKTPVPSGESAPAKAPDKVAEAGK